MLALTMAFALSFIGGSPANLETHEGTLEVVRAAPRSQVRLKTSAGSHLTVVGDFVGELKRIQSFRVKLQGTLTGQKLDVTDYTIMDIGGGRRPLTGLVVAHNGHLALQEDAGPALLLNLSPRGKRRLNNNIGAKIWVSGKLLVSGEYKVSRYGILRKAKPAAAPPQTNDDSAKSG